VERLQPQSPRSDRGRHFHLLILSTVIIGYGTWLKGAGGGH
jgi:hypothetical protein